MNHKQTIRLWGFLCITSLAWGQQPAPAPATRVRLLNLRRAILECNDGKKAAADLNKRFAPRNAELEKKHQELLDIQKQGEALVNPSDAQKRYELLQIFQRKSKELDRDKQDLTEEIQQAETELINSIGKKIIAALGQHAAKQGYELILEASNQEIGVLWFPKALEITDEVIAAVNAAAAPPAKPATPPDISGDLQSSF